MKISTAVEVQKGHDHSEYEDDYCIIEDFNPEEQLVWGAVLDGHFYDAKVANLGAVKLHGEFLKALTAGQTRMRAMRTAYLAVDAATKDMHSGACAATFLLDRVNRTVTVGNAGDVRILFVTERTRRQLTVDHRADATVEKRRVEKVGGLVEGGYVINGRKVLMIARSLGDHAFKTVGVIPNPQLRTFQLPNEPFWLVTASDGLWDYQNNHQVAAAVRKLREPASIAKALRHIVMDQHAGRDDLTVLVLAGSV